MREAIKKLVNKAENRVIDRAYLAKIKREISSQFTIPNLLNATILKEYRRLLAADEISPNLSLEHSLIKRAIRTMSGIAPVAVLTKPFPCPGTCAYCPHEKDVPVSYLSNEPAVMRAIRCHYDPYWQVISRLRLLEDNGHQPDKIELIVIGGTWSYLPEKYKYWYIANCFRAANDFARIRQGISAKPIYSPLKLSSSLVKLKDDLMREQEKNEKALYHIIGLTLETRPDYIDETEVLQMRELGCTRVELGVQAIDDDILKLNKRGHGVAEVAMATKLLRQSGFKVTYHIMPALPGSNPEKDVEMFAQLFGDERFQPDQIKFYPTVVTKGSLLYRWYQQGKYQPYTDSQLQDIIIRSKAIVPRYVRIIRLIRDIPAESIVAGNKITNLRQIMEQQGVKCNCIRCREVGDGEIQGEAHLFVDTYQASGGQEYFISFEDGKRRQLYGFCRLRIDKESPVSPAIIRELHVYGQLAPVGQIGKIQHQGLGRKLIAQAEKIAQTEGAAKLAVISGVGVRGYYRKFGYRLKKTYMVKSLTKPKR